jgi:hypothetical protein
MLVAGVAPEQMVSVAVTVIPAVEEAAFTVIVTLGVVDEHAPLVTTT